MLATLVNAWRTPELRTKLLFTAFILAVYRFGSFIPSPGVDSSALASSLANQGGIYSLLSVFSGGGLSRLSLFALGIMPYITASIILQLLTVVVPSLEKLGKKLPIVVPRGLGGMLRKRKFESVIAEDVPLCESTGEVRTHTGGRPAKLFRFRREVLLERPSPGVRVKLGRG